MSWFEVCPVRDVCGAEHDGIDWVAVSLGDQFPDCAEPLEADGRGMLYPASSPNLRAMAEAKRCRRGLSDFRVEVFGEMDVVIFATNPAHFERGHLAGPRLIWERENPVVLAP